MKKIDWVRKLTSRKLWPAVASFVSMMIVAPGGAENTATQVRCGLYHWRGTDRPGKRRSGNNGGSDRRGSVRVWKNRNL